MATRRSLNKLEFKAHMSIHNLVDVKEDETHGSNFTRDRFGKNHRLQNEDGTFRIQRSRRKLSGLTVLTWTAVLLGGVCSDARSGEAVSPRNTDIKAESSDLNGLLLDRQLNPPQEKLGFPVNESSEISINENGDPNLNMKF